MGFKDLKIWMKLALGFGLVVLIFCGFVAYQLNSLTILGEKQHEGMHKAEDAVAIGEIGYRVEHFSVLVNDALLMRNLNDVAAEYEKFTVQAHEDIQTVAGFARSEAEVEASANFAKSYEECLKVFQDEMLPYLRFGSRDKNVTGEMGDRINASRAEAVNNLQTMIASLQNQMHEADAYFDGLHGTIMSASIAASAGGVLAAFITAVLISLSISRPLGKACGFAKAISEGDFSSELNIRKRKDEIGTVADSMRGIKQTLNEVAGELNRVVGRMSIGHLTERGDASGFKGEYAGMVEGVNKLSDVLVGYLDKIQTPIMAIDKDFNVLYMNKFGAEAGQAIPQKLLGTKCFEHFRTGDCRTENCACARSMKIKATANSETDAHPSAADLEIKYTANPILDDQGQVVGAIEIVIDQTEIIQAQRRMVRLAEKADGISQRLSSASEELAAQIEQASRGSDVQRDRIAETATSMDEMNATVLEVAKNASSASESSVKAREEAREGSVVVGNAVKAIEQVHKAAMQLQENMKDLGNQAENIGEVMNVISDIADQTNLLALNAAIEAARAGDAGRGFAVVADEVRKLAEKTMSATSEVGNSIRSIQDAAKNNLESMNKAAETVEEATGLANQSGDVLRKIVELVTQNANMVESIATAAEEQSAASEEISRAIEEVNQVVGETAEGMNQSSRAMQELASMSTELTQLINELQSGNNEMEPEPEEAEVQELES